MDVKLTLSLDKSVIDQAKKYARRNNTSLSKLIESYLGKVTASDKEVVKISPLVKSLSGVIDLSRMEDRNKGYADYLGEKYNH
jgi:hypothetical protein